MGRLERGWGAHDLASKVCRALPSPFEPLPEGGVYRLLPLYPLLRFFEPVRFAYIIAEDRARSALVLLNPRCSWQWPAPIVGPPSASRREFMRASFGVRFCQPTKMSCFSGPPPLKTRHFHQLTELKSSALCQKQNSLFRDSYYFSLDRTVLPLLR